LWAVSEKIDLAVRSISNGRRRTGFSLARLSIAVAGMRNRGGPFPVRAVPRVIPDERRVSQGFLRMR